MSTTYYPQSGNAETTCDVGGGVDINADLGLSPGVGTHSGNTQVETPSWEHVFAFDLNVSADNPATGSHDCGLNISTLDANCALRYRLQAVDDSGCGIDNSSAYSAEYTTTGNKTDSLSLTWDGTSDRLRMSVELQRTSGHGNTTAVITLGSNTFIIAPWDLPDGAARPTISRPVFHALGVIAAVILTPQLPDVPDAEPVVAAPVPTLLAAPAPVIITPQIADEVPPLQGEFLFATVSRGVERGPPPPVINTPQGADFSDPPDGSPLFARQLPKLEAAPPPVVRVQELIDPPRGIPQGWVVMHQSRAHLQPVIVTPQRADVAAETPPGTTVVTTGRTLESSPPVIVTPQGDDFTPLPEGVIVVTTGRTLESAPPVILTPQGADFSPLPDGSTLTARQLTKLDVAPTPVVHVTQSADFSDPPDGSSLFARQLPKLESGPTPVVLVPQTPDVAVQETPLSTRLVQAVGRDFDRVRQPVITTPQIADFFAPPDGSPLIARILPTVEAAPPPIVLTPQFADLPDGGVLTARVLPALEIAPAPIVVTPQGADFSDPPDGSPLLARVLPALESAPAPVLLTPQMPDTDGSVLTARVFPVLESAPPPVINVPQGADFSPLPAGTPLTARLLPTLESAPPPIVIVPQTVDQVVEAIPPGRILVAVPPNRLFPVRQVVFSTTELQDIISGPFCLDATDVFTAGAVASDDSSAGAVADDDSSAGSVAGDVNCG